MKPTTLLWCAAVVAACANVPHATPDQESELDRVRALLANDPVQALDAAETLLATNPGLREARLVAAECSLRLAKSGRGQANLHLHDAARNFDLALKDGVDAEQPTALLMLAECQFELGEFERGREAALRAAAAFAATDVPENRAGAADAMLLAGKCDLHPFVAARQAERADGTPDSRGKIPMGKATLEMATRAAHSFQQARRERPADATLQLAMLQQWLEQPSEVVREYEQGIRETPTETAIHDAFLGWMRDRGHFDALVGAYAQFVREAPTTTILRWHQGRAIYTRADKLRADANYLGAIAEYTKAEHVFGEYLAMVPPHADAANQWRALCQLSMARCAVDMGDLAAAEQHLFAAGAASPRATEYVDDQPQLPDSFGSHFQSVVFAINAALTQSGTDALQKALAFNERVLAQYPDRWGFVYNNAALAARDLGVKVAQDGDAARAKELWEASYRHYEKAVELWPDDARTVNDCGLMLIYHLDRDFDRARTLFERAIELGKAQLAAMPADVDARERERLEEAVGDAYQNVAVLLKEQLHKPFAEYREFCEQAVKYYPYQRREAATLLRTEGAGDLGSTARSATAARLAAQQGGAAEALAKRRADIDAKVAAEDFDGALAVLDELAKDCKDHAPFQFLKGQVTLKLAAQARDNGRRGVDLFFQDAVAALKRAVELDSEPPAPRQLLAQAQYDAGDAEGSARTLTGLLLHLQSQGGGKPEELLALHTLRANAAARAYAAKKSQEQDDKELLTQARASFRVLEEQGKLLEELKQLGKLEGSALATWSATEQWAAAPAEAVNVYVRALAKAPEDPLLLGALLKTAYDQKQLPLAVDALAKRDDAIGLWYLGEARFWLADAQQSTGDSAAALKTLDAARDAFTASMQKNPSYRDTCEQKLAMCLGKKGSIAIAGDDVANAEKWLLEAARARPDQVGADLGSNQSTKRGILFVVDKHMRKRDLGKVEAIARAAADAANSDVDLLNNAGLFARDWGNQLERNGKQTEAMEMYEQSYKAYRRAQQLDPENVRLRNDCALIAIYHLDRDWDLSKQLLDSAIADGDKMLRDNPPDDPNTKQQLEEAVGDCYENLALWQLKHGKDPAAAKAAAEKSRDYHPGQQRPGARRHIAEAERQLQGK